MSRISTSVIGTGDPQFAGVTITRDETGKILTATFANPQRSGNVTVAVDAKLEQTLLKMEEMSKKGTAYAGAYAQMLGGSDFHANHSNPAHSTKTPTGSMNAMMSFLGNMQNGGKILHTAEAIGDFIKVLGGKKVQAVASALAAVGAVIPGISIASTAQTPEQKQEAFIQAGTSIVQAGVELAGGVYLTAAQAGLAGLQASSAGSAYKPNAGAVNTMNLRIDREQKFIEEQQKSLMESGHKGQLGSLRMQINGKDIDVANALKDPAQRQQVLDEIARREANASSPETKQQFVDMKKAAQDYIELAQGYIALEGRRPSVTQQQTVVATSDQQQPTPARDSLRRQEAAVAM